MKILLTNEEMREADSRAIAGGIPSLTLMERAGVALADEAERLAREGEILCVCGGGNNGGDGFVCARVLKERGRRVRVFALAGRRSPDCKENQRRWEEIGEISPLPVAPPALVVDCLYGTGFHGELTGEGLKTVEIINEWRGRGTKILSADIPSGVNGSNGVVANAAVVADVTLCIGERKLGCLLNDGIDYCGKLLRADIGIVVEGTPAFLAEEEDIRLPKRRRNSHKGSYGRAVIVAGSEEYTGAAYLSAAAQLASTACLRAGAGYTTLCVPKEILPYYILKNPEILLKSTNEGGRYAFNEEMMRELLAYDSIAYGMGMGVSSEVYAGAKWLLENYEGKLLLDADGLNSLSVYEEDIDGLFARKKCAVVVTPHCKEFSRLTGKRVEEILLNGVSLAKEYAGKWGVVVYLKGAVSVVADGARTAIVSRGTSGQAKGGSGDCLSGVLCALMAEGLTPYEGGVAGGFLTGLAAELATKEVGEYSLTASDCIDYLGKAFLRLTENAHEEGDEE